MATMKLKLKLKLLKLLPTQALKSNATVADTAAQLKNANDPARAPASILLLLRWR